MSASVSRDCKEEIQAEKYKWATIVEYDGGGTTGAMVPAVGEMEAWEKILAAFNCGRNVSSIRLAMILTDERSKL